VTSASHDPPTVVIIGAGITGLTAAHAVLREHPEAAVVVLEADSRVGGKILTTEFRGHRIDCGADAFLARVPEAVDLCRELGLDDELVTPASRTAYVFARGELRPFPPGLVLGVPTDLDALSGAGVVSDEAVSIARRDLTMSEPTRNRDESVGALVRRRIGDEIYETLVAPLLSGVYAGDADRISAELAAPQFLEALRTHGSLIAGLRSQSAASASDKPVFYGLRHGTQTLVDALASLIVSKGATLLLSTRADAVERHEQGLRVTTATGEVFDTTAVIATAPDRATARLLTDTAPAVAAELEAIPYASVVLVTLAFAPDAFERDLDGTGFLVPAREPYLLTACSWASTKWAHLDGESVILRASAGRHGDERALRLDDDELVERLVQDLRHTMGLVGAPTARRVTRWPDALPQFPPGHSDRARRWQRALDDVLPGVVLAGAGIGGLGIPACIRQANTAAAEVLDVIGPSP